MKVTSNAPNTNLAGIAGKSQTDKVDKTKSDRVSIKSKADAKPSVLSDLDSSTKVDVSSRARDINRAKELARPSDDIDEAKVARLQQMIDAGKYKVDSAAIADRMLEAQAWTEE